MPFRRIKKIGEGRYANVYKVEDDEGDEYAFKMVKAKDLKYIELDILSRLKSPYLIRIAEPKIANIAGQGFLEDLKEDNLDNLDTKKIPYIQLKRIIISSIYGLRCMHRKGFLHLDISPTNILYGKDNEENYLAYLSDFGWSVRCDDAYEGILSSKIVKYNNNPLEVLEPQKKYTQDGIEVRKYSDKSDIWQLGMVILELLGSKFSASDTQEYIKNIRMINDSFIEQKIRLYNKEKMTNYEELKLKELLVNMLKLDSSKRISSKDIHKLNFFQSTNRLLNLNEDCVLEKPTEMVFLPYVSPKTDLGLKQIRSHYYINSSQKENITIMEYFLALQIYLRLMAKASPYLEDEEFTSLIQKAIDIAENYYRAIDNGDYRVAKELNSEIGYNFYYCANYLEDLLILNHYLMEGNIDLLGFYNLINTEKIFTVFKEKYVYENRKRNSVDLYTFLNLEIPNKKDDTEVDFLTNLDYHEIVSENKEEENLINSYKSTELEFRKDIIDFFSDRIIKKYVEDDIDIITLLEKMIKDKKYIENYKSLSPNLVNKNIASTLININEFFNYGNIEIDIYGNVDLSDKKLLNENIKYYLVKYRERYSLLVKDNDTMVHYYAEKNNYLRDYLKSKNFKYKNDFSYGINTCCKILEICIIYIIYYNLKNKNRDYHFKCLDYHTIKTVLLILSI